MLRSEPTEQDIATMLSNLEQAHKYNGDAKKAYQAQDYRRALQNYHHCLLYAKAVVQLTSSNLREMARAQLLMQSLQGEGQEESLNKKEKNKTSNDGNGANKKELETDGKHEDVNPIVASSSTNKTQQHSRNRLDSTTRGQEISQEAKELIAKCYNNLAACILGRSSNSKEDYMRAVTYCENVLKDEPNNEKANFRKGVALMRADKWEKAIEQFELCKNNAQAKINIMECQRNNEEDRRRRDAEIRANFAKARAMDEALQQNGHGHPPQPPAAADGNPPTMNGHVQHQ